MATIAGGEKLEQRLRMLALEVSNPGRLRVGFLEDATYPDGTPVAMIAAIQNWGAPSRGIPPRPFFSNMILKNAKNWGNDVAVALKRTNFNAKDALGLVGKMIEGQLRKSIQDTNSPPLSPRTLAKRGYTGKAFNPKDPKTFGAKPLVDTGHMLGSVNSEVV